MPSNQIVQAELPGSGAVDANTRALKGVTGLLAGEADSSAPVTLTGLTDNTAYALTVLNQGTGGHINVPGLFLVNNLGVNAAATTVSSLDVTGGAILHSTLHTVGAATLDSTLQVGGAATLSSTLHGVGAVTFDSTLQVTGQAHLLNGLVVDTSGILVTGGGLSVTGLTTLEALTATGNVALGDANADTLTVIATSTFRNAASAVQLYVDPGNNRVIVGSATAIPSDTTPALHVAGRLYVGPDSANDEAILIRRSASTSGGWAIGVTAASNGDLVFKDDGDTERFRVGDASSTNQAKVTGQLDVTNGLVVDASGILVSAGGLNVTGSSVFSTTVTLTTGNLVAITGGAILGTNVFSGSELLRVAGSVLFDAMRTDTNKNKILHDGSGAKGTGDTTGYVFLPYSLGKPTGNPGTPTGSSGSVPLALDLSNNKICMWTGAAWICTAALT